VEVRSAIQDQGRPANVSAAATPVASVTVALCAVALSALRHLRAGAQRLSRRPRPYVAFSFIGLALIVVALIPAIVASRHGTLGPNTAKFLFSLYFMFLSVSLMSLFFI